jgi:hypothetical protein
VIDMTVPAYLPYVVLAGCLGTQAAIFVGLRAAAAPSSLPAGPPHPVSRSVSVVLGAWFVLAVWLSCLGVFQRAADRVPTIQYGLLTPILLGWWFLQSSRGRRLLGAIPAQWVIGVQIYRALGAVFLILYAAQRLPGAFAWPAGVGDVAVGLLAPIIALRYARSPRESKALAVAWNVVGLTDLVVAVSMGFLTAPSPLQLFGLDAPNELIGAFPLALVPLYLVPISVVLHFASLRQLKASGGLSPR